MTATVTATAMLFPMLSLPLEFIFHQISHDRTTNGTQETVSCILAEIVSGYTSADRAENTAFAFGHRWSVGVIVGRILVAGLRGRLMRLAVCIIDLLWRSLIVLRLLRVLLMVLGWAAAGRKEGVGRVLIDGKVTLSWKTY